MQKPEIAKKLLGCFEAHYGKFPPDKKKEIDGEIDAIYSMMLDQELIMAAKKNNLSLVHQCLEGGATVEAKNTALRKAISAMPIYSTTDDVLQVREGYTKMGEKTMGDTRVVKRLLEQEANPTTEIDAPIFKAFSHMNTNAKKYIIIQLLFEEAIVETNPNVKDNSSGNTILWEAIKYQNLPLVKYMLHKKANPNITSGYGTPLNGAVELNNVEIARELLEAKADPNTSTPLIQSIKDFRKDSLSMVELLVKYGADPNVTASLSRTPLMEAALMDRKRVKGLLLSFLENIGNLSPGEYEDSLKNKLKDYPEILKFFTDKKINIKNIDSEISENSGVVNALVQEYVENYLAILKLLLEKGAKVNLADPESKGTALHVAAWVGNLDAVKLLINGGAGVNLINMGGQTPLHLAVQNGHLEIVKLLLDRNADPNVENEDGKTPLDLAEEELVRSDAVKP